MRIKHFWRCIPWLTCTCPKENTRLVCPVCVKDGFGPLCDEHIAEANRFSGKEKKL